MTLNFSSQSLMLNRDGSLSEDSSPAIRMLFLTIGERLIEQEFKLPADIHLDIEIDHWDWRICASVAEAQTETNP